MQPAPQLLGPPAAMLKIWPLFKPEHSQGAVTRVGAALSDSPLPPCCLGFPLPSPPPPCHAACALPDRLLTICVYGSSRALTPIVDTIGVRCRLLTSCELLRGCVALWHCAGSTFGRLCVLMKAPQASMGCTASYPCVSLTRR